VPYHACMMSVKDPKDSSLIDSKPCPCLDRFLRQTSPPLLPLFLSRGSDGLADGAATLPGVQAALEGLGTLLDDLSTLGEDELDVGGVGHVRVDLGLLGCIYAIWTGCTYTTVSTVSAPSLLGSLVDLDVLDDQVLSVETLGVGVGLGVLEETDEDLSGLDGPAGLGDTESLACSSQRVLGQLLTCTPLQSARIPLFQCILPSNFRVRVRLGRLTLSSASSAASVPPHGNGLLVLQDISEVGERAVELPAVDGLGGLAGVLEGNAEVAAAGAGRLCAVNGGCSVANLQKLIPCPY